MPTENEAVWGALEAGGTKFVCAVGRGPGKLEARMRFSTTTPDETLARVLVFFREQQAHFDLQGIGVGCFGPLDLNMDSPRYGFITNTPKPGWCNTEVVGVLQRGLQLPVAFDTDVNAAAVGEGRWGAARGLHTYIYLTIGTGIGGGAVVEGRVLHGMTHPEMGHMPMPHDREIDPYKGNCPFHGDCLEGLAAGPALEARWGRPAQELAPDHPAWELQAEYLATALASYVCILSPQRIILGGGVMHQTQLFTRIRSKVQAKLNGYIQASALLEDIDNYIVPPGLGDEAGILGALALSRQMIA